MSNVDALLERQQVELTAEGYVEGVLGGDVVACKWVRFACERHRTMQAQAEELGIYFDNNAAKVVIAFFSLLRHSKGEWAGMPLRLEPWQQFILWMVFGWKRAEHERWIKKLPNGLVENTAHTRLFRTVYLEVARKNGKSTLGAGLGLYLLLADGEPGAEVYTAATKKDQAKITHGEATRMAKSSALVRREVEIVKNNIHVVETNSKYEPLGADSDTMDGLNVHGAIVDELHAHKTRAVWDVLDTATGSRRQPLMMAITTSGYDRNSVCWYEHEYTEKVLEGSLTDWEYFGIIYTLDEGDEWDDEAVWGKANPNLGVSKKYFDMVRKAGRAKEIPSAQNAFKRKDLDLWTQASIRWVPLEHWQACAHAVDPLGLSGRTGYGGLDLSSNTDVTAWVMVFPSEVAGDVWPVLCRFFIPENNIMERVKVDRVPFDVWVRQGFVTATPGNVIDYDFIVAQIDDDMQRYDIQEIAFDRWGAAQIQTTLMAMGGDDLLAQFGQGYRSMSPAMKETEKLILSHQLAHGNNPVLNWMASNVVARSDPAENIKPDKEKSRERIDGMVALMMAIDRSVRHQKRGSVYEERGIVDI